MNKNLHLEEKALLIEKLYTQLLTDLDEPIITDSFTKHALPFIPKDSTVLFVITDCLESLDCLGKITSKATKVCWRYSDFTSCDE